MSTIFRGSRALGLAVAWVSLIFPATGFAKQLCEDDLLRSYGTEFSEALVGRPTTARTLRPEAGSIAAAHPDILARVATMARLLESDRHGFGEYTFVWTELQNLALDLRDPRLAPLVKSVTKKLVAIEDPDAVAREADLYYLARNARIEVAHRDLRRLADHMWEFAVALMVAGQRIYLGKTIRDVHPKIPLRKPEFDIITIDAAGAERWIEVKNAKVPWWAQANYLRAIGEQAELTANIRARMPKHRITRELIFVEPFPYVEYQRVIGLTGYDRMNSLFLDSPDDPTPNARD